MWTLGSFGITHSIGVEKVCGTKCRKSLFRNLTSCEMAHSIGNKKASMSKDKFAE